MKIIAFKLIEEGKITKYVDKDGITRVDLNGLESIEVGTTSRILINYYRSHWIRKIKTS